MKKILLVLCVLICLILGCDKKDTPSVQTDCWKFSVPDSKDYMPSVICGETETEIMERAMRLEELIGLPVVVEKIADWDKNEGEPLDMAEQTRINNQLLGLWEELDHGSTQCQYRGFRSDFQYISYLLFLGSGDRLLNSGDGKPYHFEKGPECSKGTVYTLVLNDKIKNFICKYDGLVYIWWQENSNPDIYVGNAKYAYRRAR
ncbi:hypothetical protein [Alistipes indistinctus]|uniref:hypothetical protein n=1 Tax=Alistipes indistinctus TaxID=626932 RepID=UPI00241E92F0|nr:hypothetical protein [Alistipes indistinctus]